MIFHIAVLEEWEVAIRDGVYTPPSIAAEGFIHCSTCEQIIATANSFYRGRQDLMLLVIDEGKVSAPLRYEAPVAADDVRAVSRFPHIYGALNLDAVIRAEAFPCGSDGSFELPSAFDE